MRNPRAMFAAGILLVALVGGVVLLTLAGGDSGGERREPRRPVRAELRLEQFMRHDTGERELLVSLSAPQLNTLAVTGGERVVLLRCVDSAGAPLIRRPTQWPLLEEEGFLPHIHSRRAASSSTAFARAA